MLQTDADKMPISANQMDDLNTQTNERACSISCKLQLVIHLLNLLSCVFCSFVILTIELIELIFYYKKGCKVIHKVTLQIFTEITKVTISHVGLAILIISGG